MDEHMATRWFGIIIISLFILGCTTIDNNVSIGLSDGPLEIHTPDFTIIITKYCAPIPHSDSNECGEFLNYEDVLRGEAEFK